MRPNYSLHNFDSRDSQSAEWRALVRACPGWDVYWLPEYLSLFESSEGEIRAAFGGRARMLSYGNAEDYILYPFFERPLSELPFAASFPGPAGDWQDIISPYGFGGPLVHLQNATMEKELWEGFDHEVRQYCAQRRVVSEFMRFSPYSDNHRNSAYLAGISLEKSFPVVYVDLSKSRASISSEMSRGNKSSIAKARNLGVKIECSSSREDVDKFYELYTATMLRREAHPKYFFPRSFFFDLFEKLPDNARLMRAVYDGQTVAGGLLLLGEKIAHYYLGGSDAAFLHLRPNNLLFFEAIQWAKDAGFQIFDFGGGYVQSLELMRFKGSFSKSRADFWVCGRVHDVAAYAQLTAARMGSRALPAAESDDYDFFPAYRQ